MLFFFCRTQKNIQELLKMVQVIEAFISVGILPSKTCFIQSLI